MPCFILNDSACLRWIEISRGFAGLLNYVSRFGTTGAVLALGLVLVGRLARYAMGRSRGLRRVRSWYRSLPARRPLGGPPNGGDFLLTPRA